MRNLTPLDQIPLPTVKADEVYSIRLFERSFEFRGLKALLGAADVSKAGDRHAHLAADDELAREAARSLLSNLTLGHLYEHPLVDDAGRIDAVMHANYDIDPK